jgi:hypothetical protein
MDVFYIRLCERTTKLEDALSPAKFVTYAEKGDGGPGCISWSTTGPLRNAPLAYLTDQARNAIWFDEASLVLHRHNATASLGNWLNLGPKLVAEADLMKFNQSYTTKQENHANAPILRDLQRIARQIVGRKPVFVFPGKWPVNNPTPVAEIVMAMVKEVCAHFRYAPVGEELPWTFLSENVNPDGTGPLGNFIRSLHNEMLTDTSDVKIADWRRKSGAILLSGPTGSGKSYAARLLATEMGDGSPPVEVNLAAISEELLESRMRGYEQGAFTGADKNGRKGWFEEAHGGVLFLDEFQSVPPFAQVQLLDVLNAVSDDIQIARVGAEHKRSNYRVKVILAINEDIGSLLHEKRLRKDLYYRVRFIQTFPALKERLSSDRDHQHRYLHGMMMSYRWKSLRTIEELCQLDVGLRGMVRSFFPLLRQEALSALARQDWDGNFRELERVAFDLFNWYDDRHEQNDYTRMGEADESQNPQYIGEPEVTNLLKTSHTWSSSNQQADGVDGMTRRKREMLDGIQDALRESGFIIETALKSQPYFRSRPTLLKYLRDNVEHLAADVRLDSRMIGFMDRNKIKRNGTTNFHT